MPETATMAVIAPGDIVVLLALLLAIFFIFIFPVAWVLWLLRWQRSQYGDPSYTYNETGGLRCGETLQRAWNFSWPFARLRASAEEIQIDTAFPWESLRLIQWCSSLIGFRDVRWESTLRFHRREIRELSRFRGAISTGLRIEHVGADSPPMVVFWTWRFPTLKAGLERFGYFVLD